MARLNYDIGLEVGTDYMNLVPSTERSMPVIPALRKLRWKYHKLKDSLAYCIANHCDPIPQHADNLSSFQSIYIVAAYNNLYSHLQGI